MIRTDLAPEAKSPKRNRIATFDIVQPRIA
jgi:hypothetical protein